MVFVELLDDIYKRVLDTAARMQLPLEQVESRMLLVNHADLTDRLLNAWNFPKRLTDTIAMHHLSIEKIVELAPSKVADVSTLVLADRLAHALLLGSSGNNCQYPTEALVQTLGLKPEAIKLIEAQIPEQTAALKYAMLQSENGPPCAVYRQRLLAKFHSPIRALYVSTNPTIDGYRILMEQLGDPNDDRRPNVAFLYLTDLRDSEALFKNLRERENAAGLKPLPLIVISPLSKLRLEPKITAGREYKIMPSPFSLARLADTVNSLPLSEE
jgi:hypothetical protein